MGTHYGHRTMYEWQEPVLFFYHVGPRHEWSLGHQVGGKYLYPPSHLVDPKLTLWSVCSSVPFSTSTRLCSCPFGFILAVFCWKQHLMYSLCVLGGGGLCLCHEDMWRSKDNSWELHLSFLCVDLKLDLSLGHGCWRQSPLPTVPSRNQQC